MGELPDSALGPTVEESCGVNFSRGVGEVVCLSSSKNDENVSEIINFNCDAHKD
jgi:hypothetical protein